MKSARILIIEKDEALARKEAQALENAGYRVTIAPDVNGGLKELYEACPDVIIMAGDLHPVTLERYLRVRQASYIPIVVLGSEEEAVEILESGADACMTRPPDIALLVARVRALLRRKLKDDPPVESPGLELKDRLKKQAN